MNEKYYHGFGSFPQFWYFYLSQHMKTGTRAFHYVGTWIAVLSLPLALWDQVADFSGWGAWRWSWVAMGILTTYILGFVSHWTIEKNQPATFVYPLLSVGGDLYMFGLTTVRRIPPDVQEIRRRLASGWIVNRYGLYPPEYAREHRITMDRTVVSAAV